LRYSTFRKLDNFTYLKNLATILTAVLYLAMTTGMVLSAHYCMGDLAEISLGHDTTEKCADCGMDNNGCCHDDVKVFRITDAHGPSGSLTINKMVDYRAFIPTPPSLIEVVQIQFQRAPELIPDPPEPDGISLCIRHAVFRI
jgi:hypothetical protein